MKLKLMRGYSEAEPKVHIGTLEYVDGLYKWEYTDACEHYDFDRGFFEVAGLPFGEMSQSEDLFWYFKDRISPRKRTDFQERLAKAGLSEYNEWEYTVATGLKLATDSDELVRCEDGL